MTITAIDKYACALQAHAEEIAGLKAAKAEAEAKQAAAEQAFHTLKADLVGRELSVAEEQQQAQAQPASKKKKKQKKVATSEVVHLCT